MPREDGVMVTEFSHSYLAFARPEPDPFGPLVHEPGRDMRLALFGPPGAGKGTQATLLVERYGLRHISTGAMLRAAISSGSELGRKAEVFMNSGQLVPGHLIRALAEAAITDAGCDDFVLDGYPRTVEQAEWLTDFLAQCGMPLQAVVSLRLPEDAVVKRISRRRVNRITGENFHLDFKPPPADQDPGLFIQRDDDTPEAVRKRLSVYHEETRPVEAFFRDRGVLLEVDGDADVDEVFARVEEVLRFAAVSANPA
jgi:adenylate kinase